MGLRAALAPLLASTVAVLALGSTACSRSDAADAAPAKPPALEPVPEHALPAAQASAAPTPPQSTPTTEREAAPPKRDPCAPRAAVLGTKPPPRHLDREPTPAHARALVKDAAARYPCLTKLEVIGLSHQSRPIHALAIGRHARRGDRPAILLNGAHHGDEPLSASFVLDAIRVLLGDQENPAVAKLLEEVTIWAVPVVNPDGLHVEMTQGRRRGRKNGRDNDLDGHRDVTDGVDINRNYPFRWGSLGEVGSVSVPIMRSYRGRKPASEPETRAMMRLADREVFAASISYHIGTVALLYPYTINKTVSPTPHLPKRIARELAARMPVHPHARLANGFPVRRNLYPVDGTDQDWLYHAHGTMALLIEGALQGTVPAQTPQLVRAIRPSWKLLASRVAQGPAIHGRVIDADGTPVVAEVTLASETLYEGERWRTRCRDGAFSRLVAEPGRQVVHVRLGGEVVAERAVIVGEQPSKLVIKLDRRVPAKRCRR